MVEHIQSGEALPSLTIGVESVSVERYAAVPTLRFTARIADPSGRSIRHLALTTQLRIAANLRGYEIPEQQRLGEIFGPAGEWGRTMRSLLWTHTNTTVPGFTGDTTADLLVACTYDFDVTASKYLHALSGGEVPLEFLFSGSVFYLADGALRVARLGWDTECAFRMPVRVWTELMAHYFPDGGWLRLDRDTIEELHDYRAGRGMTNWDETVRSLLVSAGRGAGQGVEDDR